MIKKRHAWLVKRIREEALAERIKKYGRGRLIDIGCGEKPYVIFTKGLVVQHLGIDHPGTFHEKTSIDIFATAYHTSLADAVGDVVLSTAVLEHLEEPEAAIREMYRILKPGGHVILTAPFYWQIHESPRDFFRFTRYGLEYLFTKTGFQIVEIYPLSGFLVTFSQQLCNFLQQYRHRRSMAWLISITQEVLQSLAYRLRRWDKSSNFTWMYLVVARKKP